MCQVLGSKNCKTEQYRGNLWVSGFANTTASHRVNICFCVPVLPPRQIPGCHPDITSCCSRYQCFLPSHWNELSLFCTMKKQKQRKPQNKNFHYTAITAHLGKSGRRGNNVTQIQHQVYRCVQCTGDAIQMEPTQEFRCGRGHTYMTGVSWNFPNTSHVHPDFL